MNRRPAAALVAQLEAERIRQGLTVTAWADRSGVQRDTYYRAVRHGNTTVATLALLAGGLGWELTVAPSSRDHEGATA